MTSEITHLIREDLQHFNAYSSARDEAQGGKIWLNANELPWSLEQSEHAEINRYPEKQPTQLIKKLASIYTVDAEQIALLRGSGEAIDLLTRLFCRAGKDAVMICPPTFGLYAVCAQIQGASVVEIPLQENNNYQLDVPLILNRWTPAVKIIFLCTPNNPTGGSLNPTDILQLCTQLAGKTIIVVILRTFSKAYGLAGARLGALLADKALIHWLAAIMAPYPLPTATIKTALQAVSTHQLKKVAQNIACITAERDKLLQALPKLPFIKKIWPSDANYILIKATDAPKLMHECMTSGIVLRSMHNRPGLENCIRISVGSPEENAALMETLKLVTLK
jgi:histidinol-phosphate aminotransferase